MVIRNHRAFFMNDNEFKLQREVKELKVEVRRLRHTVEGALVVVGLIAILIFPQLLIWAAALAVLILFGFLVSPKRRMIFSYFFHKRDGHESDT